MEFKNFALLIIITSFMIIVRVGASDTVYASNYKVMGKVIVPIKNLINHPKIVILLVGKQKFQGIN